MPKWTHFSLFMLACKHLVCEFISKNGAIERYQCKHKGNLSKHHHRSDGHPCCTGEGKCSCLHAEPENGHSDTRNNEGSWLLLQGERERQDSDQTSHLPPSLGVSRIATYRRSLQGTHVPLATRYRSEEAAGGWSLSGKNMKNGAY